MSAPTYFDLDVARQIGNVFTGPVQFSSTNAAQFGGTAGAPAASIAHDGTNLLANPKVTGTGFFDIAGDLRFLSAGIGGASATSIAMISGQGISSTTYTQVLTASLTHTGAGASLRAMAFTLNAAGTATSPAPVNFCISNLAANIITGSPSPNVTGFNGQAACTVLAQTAPTGVTKIVTLRGLAGAIAGDALGHTQSGTGALTFIRRTITAGEPGAMTGTSGVVTDHAWAFVTEGDSQINSDKLFIVGGTSSVKNAAGFGDFQWVSASSVWRFRTAAATFFDLAANTMTFADAKNLAFNTTTGTKIGTATGQKIGFWNVAPVIQPASANQAILTNSTGGTYDGTLVDVGLVFSQANINNNFTDVFTLLNEIRTALVNTGIMKGAA